MERRTTDIFSISSEYFSRSKTPDIFTCHDMIYRYWEQYRNIWELQAIHWALFHRLTFHSGFPKHMLLVILYHMCGKKDSTKTSFSVPVNMSMPSQAAVTNQWTQTYFWPKELWQKSNCWECLWIAIANTQIIWWNRVNYKSKSAEHL